MYLRSPAARLVLVAPLLFVIALLIRFHLIETIEYSVESEMEPHFINSEETVEKQVRDNYPDVPSFGLSPESYAWKQYERIVQENSLNRTGTDFNSLITFLSREQLTRAAEFMRFERSSAPTSSSPSSTNDTSATTIFKSDFAYVTYMDFPSDMNKLQWGSYLKGLFALVASWRLSKSLIPLCLLSATPVPERLQLHLKSLGVHIIDHRRFADIDLRAHPFTAATMRKLLVFRLIEFRRVMLVDLDMIFVGCADELFGLGNNDYVHIEKMIDDAGTGLRDNDIAMATDFTYGCFPHGFNAGGVLLHPSMKIWDAIWDYTYVNRAKGGCLTSDFRYYDQETLICLYSNRPKQPHQKILGQIVMLPYVYNARPQLCHECEFINMAKHTNDTFRKLSNAWRINWDIRDVKILHFYSGQKPWDKKWDLEKGLEDLSCIDQHYYQWHVFANDALKHLGFASGQEFTDDIRNITKEGEH